jgi:hypothetical protein
MRLVFTNLGNDLQGNPIFEINGERYYYVDTGDSGLGHGADHAWSSSRGSQLIFRGPDYSDVDWLPPLTVVAA